MPSACLLAIPSLAGVLFSCLLRILIIILDVDGVGEAEEVGGEEEVSGVEEVGVAEEAEVCSSLGILIVSGSSCVVAITTSSFSVAVCVEIMCPNSSLRRWWIWREGEREGEGRQGW